PVGFYPSHAPARAPCNRTRSSFPPPAPPPPPPPIRKGGESVRGWRMCLSSISCRHASSSLTTASTAAGRGCEGVADVPQQHQLLPRLLPSHSCGCCCGGSGEEGVKGWRMFFVRPAVAHAAPAPPPPPPPPRLLCPPADRTAWGGEVMGVAGVANDGFLPVARPAVARAASTLPSSPYLLFPTPPPPVTSSTSPLSSRALPVLGQCSSGGGYGGGRCVASPAPPPTPSPTSAAAAEGGAPPVATVRATPVARVSAASAVASSLLSY
ncbi:unnamed protein product, partial [Closterium sp. NIES-53]